MATRRHRKRHNKKRHNKSKGRGRVTNLRVTIFNATNRRPSQGKPQSLRSKMRSRMRETLITGRTRRIRFDSPKNEVREYTLDSSEKEYKQKSPTMKRRMKHMADCPEEFPCKYKRTIFETEKEWKKYEKLKEKRNESTGHKSRSRHYSDISDYLESIGEVFTYRP